LKKLGIDEHNQLYWNGQEVEIKKRLDLSRFQNIIAVTATAAAVLGGIGAFASGYRDFAGFLCDRGNNYLSCPLQPAQNQK